MPQVELHCLTEGLHGCQQQDRQLGPEGLELEPLLPCTPSLGFLAPPLYSASPVQPPSHYVHVSIEHTVMSKPFLLGLQSQCGATT